MSKIQITKSAVLNIEYIGKRENNLEKGMRYVAIVIEGYSDEGGEVWIYFQNGGPDRVIYDSFISFAKDWLVIGSYKFEDSFIPEKSSN